MSGAMTWGFGLSPGTLKWYDRCVKLISLITGDPIKILVYIKNIELISTDFFTWTAFPPIAMADGVIII